MRAVLQPPASMVSVVLAPRAVNSEARPTRPECPVIRPSMPAALAAAVRIESHHGAAGRGVDALGAPRLPAVR